MEGFISSGRDYDTWGVNATQGKWDKNVMCDVHKWDVMKVVAGRGGT